MCPAPDLPQTIDFREEREEEREIEERKFGQERGCGGEDMNSTR